MKFVQILEITTSKYDEFDALHTQWLADTEGTRTTLSERICRDRDRPDTYVVIVEFASYEDAMRNNDLPATAALASKVGELSDEPARFRNLDLLRVE